MSKFNRKTPHVASGPLLATGPALTHEGGAAYALDPKSELFTLAVSNFVSEDTFYESGEDRDTRYAALIRRQALEDPQWVVDLLVWLRSEANMRSAALVGAAEAAYERITAGLAQPELANTNTRGIVRTLVSSVLQRPDEPGEFIAYWRTRFCPDLPDHKAVKLPKPVKRGIADAVRRMANEPNLLKYDTERAGVRWGDVIDLTHPKPGAQWRSDLYRHAIDRRHGRGEQVPETLEMLAARKELMGLPVEQRRALLLAPDGAQTLARAGMTWEALAGWLQGAMDAAAWEAIIPSMGYMARLRNLRNFDQAGVSDAVAAEVASYLASPGQVERSRQFPYRFLSAYLNTDSDRWRQALTVALDHSVRNIPSLGGRTLVLTDTSGSMLAPLTQRSQVSCMQAAALFAVALAARGENVDLHGFATGNFRHSIRRGASVLREMERFVKKANSVGYGTEMARALRETYQGHDRVVILSDEQAFPDTTSDDYNHRYYAARQKDILASVPETVPVYAFNLGGYGTTVINAGAPNRHQLAGLTDHTFRMIPLLERGRDAGWPWEVNAEG